MVRDTNDWTRRARSDTKRAGVDLGLVRGMMSRRMAAVPFWLLLPMAAGWRINRLYVLHEKVLSAASQEADEC